MVVLERLNNLTSHYFYYSDLRTPDCFQFLICVRRTANRGLTSKPINKVTLAWRFSPPFVVVSDAVVGGVGQTMEDGGLAR